MDVFAEVKALVRGAIEALAAEGRLPAGLDLGAVTVEPPRDAGHGDMATNAAMVLARPARMSPRDIAEALAGKLREAPGVVAVEVAGPGFLNLRLEAVALARGDPGGAGGGVGLRAVEPRGGAAGERRVRLREPDRADACRAHAGAVFGDALAGLLGFAGWEVTREYYINDGGAQVDVLARSAYERYREACGLEPAIREGLYPGDYLIPVGEALRAAYGMGLLDKPEAEWLGPVREIATEAMMAMIREDLALLGVRMDLFFSEKSLYGTGLIEAALESLKGKGLLYEGVLEPPKGKLPEDWEPREQTLFRSTAYGDDTDRPVKKSDGSWTYFAPDIAYHYDKVERGFDELIDVLGADHGGYVKRMKAAVAALSRRAGAARHQALPARAALQGRRAVQDVEAGGDVRDAARRRRAGRAGRDALRDADAQERRAARLRLRQGAGAVEGEPGLLRAVCACAGAVGAGARGRVATDDGALAAADLGLLGAAGGARAGAEAGGVAAAGGDRGGEPRAAQDRLLSL